MQKIMKSKLIKLININKNNMKINMKINMKKRGEYYEIC